MRLFACAHALDRVQCISVCSICRSPDAGA